MKNSQLLDIFRGLSGSDRRALRQWVRSPFFNKRQDVIELWDYLEHEHQASTPNWDNHFIYQKLYPDKVYSDARLKSVLHFLSEQIRDFLAYQQLEQDRTQQQIYLCRALRQRKLGKAFEKSWNKLHKQQQAATQRNGHFYYQNYQIQLERYTFFHRNRRTERFQLEALTENLTTFYLAEILRQSCIIVSAQNIAREDYKQEGFQEILRRANTEAQQTHPPIAIYYCAFQMLTTKDKEDHHAQLSQLLDTYETCFPPDEIRDIYLLAINFCIQCLNKGDKTYIQRAFDWYKKGLERKILLEQNTLSPYTYYNALMLSIGLEEWEWGARFLDEYKDYLPPTERENSYRYNQAIYHFRKGDYDIASTLLQQVNFKDPLYNLTARSMLLKMHYEMEEWEMLEAHLDNFQLYIRRQRKLSYHRENYLNLIRFVRQFLRIAPLDQERLEQLTNTVEATGSVAEKDWLLRQLREG